MRSENMTEIASKCLPIAEMSVLHNKSGSNGGVRVRSLIDVGRPQVAICSQLLRFLVLTKDDAG